MLRVDLLALVGGRCCLLLDLVVKSVAIFIAVLPDIVVNLLCILLVVREDSESREEALTHLEDIEVVPAIETAKQDFADFVEQGPFHGQCLCLVSLSLIRLREEGEDAVALVCVIGLLAKFLELLLLKLFVLGHVVLDLQTVLQDHLETFDYLHDVVVLGD